MQTLTVSDLQQFTGTEEYYRHSIARNVMYTDGIKYLAETAGAYWLIDEIALAQLFSATVRREEFQVWKLKVTGSRAVLSLEDGNGNKVGRNKHITFTDFPLPEITIWFENGVIMLPSER